MGPTLENLISHPLSIQSLNKWLNLKPTQLLKIVENVPQKISEHIQKSAEKIRRKEKEKLLFNNCFVSWFLLFAAAIRPSRLILETGFELVILKVIKTNICYSIVTCR